MNNLQGDIQAELERLPQVDQQIINELLVDIDNNMMSQRQMRENVIQKIEQMIISED